MTRKVRVVNADLPGDAVQGLGEAAVVLVDAGELPADLGPRDAGSRPGRPPAVEEVRGRVPEQGAGVESAHQGEGEDDGVGAQVFVEGGIEHDVIALEVCREEGELRRTPLGGEQLLLASEPSRGV